MTSSLRYDTPVGQPDADGCYSWMSIRAGQPSKFCAEVDFKKDITVDGCINWTEFCPPIVGGGEDPITEITCEQDVVVPDGSTHQEALEGVVDYFCQCQHPLVLSKTTSETYSTGSGVVQFGWDTQQATPTATLPNVPYADYNSTTDTVTIRKQGQYKIELTLTTQTDLNSNIAEGIWLFAYHPSFAAPATFVCQVLGNRQPSDQVQTHSAHRLLNVSQFQVPYTFEFGVGVKDVAGVNNFTVIGLSLTNIFVTRICDSQTETNLIGT